MRSLAAGYFQIISRESSYSASLQQTICWRLKGRWPIYFRTTKQELFKQYCSSWLVSRSIRAVSEGSLYLSYLQNCPAHEKQRMYCITNSFVHRLLSTRFKVVSFTKCSGCKRVRWAKKISKAIGVHFFRKKLHSDYSAIPLSHLHTTHVLINLSGSSSCQHILPKCSKVVRLTAHTDCKRVQIAVSILAKKGISTFCKMTELQLIPQ